MKTIPISRGLVSMVDDCDYPALSRHAWYAQTKSILPNGEKRFCVARRRSTADGRALIYMHREIMMPMPGMAVDHIDGDGLNNRRDNLRIVTNQENSWNRLPVYGQKFKGPAFHKKTGTWLSYIRVNRASILLGRFNSEIDAALAYDAAAIKFFGEFARLNFPQSGPA